MAAYARGFDGLVGPAPRVLILGSLPGQASIDAARYYAHPRNAFWPIVLGALGHDETLPYSDRIDLIKASGIALWDVLAAAERPGSLDANIVASSEQANDIAGLLAHEPRIQTVLLNGGKAARAFRRHVSLDHLGPIDCQQLPSTSPAYAAMSLADKRWHWHEALAGAGISVTKPHQPPS